MGNIDISKLDIPTMEFVRDLVWQYEFLCSKTKEGKAHAHAYSKVVSLLVNYIQKADELQTDSCKEVD